VSRPNVLGWALGLTLAGLAGGCGSTGSPAASTAIPTANFTQRAERICVADVKGEVAALKDSGGDLQAILSKMQASSATVLTRLTALNPPADRRAAYVRFVGDVRALDGVSDSPDYAAAEAQGPRLGSKAAADARAAGLPVCAQAYGNPRQAV
jgi:hypothetical protein